MSTQTYVSVADRLKTHSARECAKKAGWSKQQQSLTVTERHILAALETHPLKFSTLMTALDLKYKYATLDKLNYLVSAGLVHHDVENDTYSLMRE